MVNLFCLDSGAFGKAHKASLRTWQHGTVKSTLLSSCCNVESCDVHSRNRKLVEASGGLLKVRVVEWGPRQRGSRTAAHQAAAYYVRKGYTKAIM